MRSREVLGVVLYYVLHNAVLEHRVVANGTGSELLVWPVSLKFPDGPIPFVVGAQPCRSLFVCWAREIAIFPVRSLVLPEVYMLKAFLVRRVSYSVRFR
jgi:hypothetical protein